MPKLKENRKYYFTVEGETEHWYFQWLQSQINDEPSSKYTVTIDCPIQKSPLSRAKSLITAYPVKITHIFDYESNDEYHKKQFISTLEEMHNSERSGKQITYLLGYSNFTFELWIILHKQSCNGSLTDRHQYLQLINNSYNENFESLRQYKQEDNFKRILRSLNLDNVKEAIQRSKSIMNMHKKNGHVLQRYRKYNYYCENPSLSIWESIEGIMKDCTLLKK